MFAFVINKTRIKEVWISVNTFSKQTLAMWVKQEPQSVLTCHYQLSLTQCSINRVACLVSSWFLPDYPQESPQVTSPWSESMSHLMRKLDRLNLDIEEALSASSSPSATPCTARKKQVRLCRWRMDCVYSVFTKQQKFNLPYLMVCALSQSALYTFLWSVCCILGHAF